MNLFTAIMDYEAGELDESGTVALFQALVDTGLAWTLQGHYGRTAVAMLHAGLLVERVAERRAQRSGLAETTFRRHHPAHPPGFRPLGKGVRP